MKFATNYCHRKYYYIFFIGAFLLRKTFCKNALHAYFAVKRTNCFLLHTAWKVTAISFTHYKYKIRQTIETIAVIVY